MKLKSAQSTKIRKDAANKASSHRIELICSEVSYIPNRSDRRLNRSKKNETIKLQVDGETFRKTFKIIWKMKSFIISGGSTVLLTLRG